MPPSYRSVGCENKLPTRKGNTHKLYYTLLGGREERYFDRGKRVYSYIHISICRMIEHSLMSTSGEIFDAHDG